MAELPEERKETLPNGDDLTHDNHLLMGGGYSLLRGTANTSNDGNSQRVLVHRRGPLPDARVRASAPNRHQNPSAERRSSSDVR